MPRLYLNFNPKTCFNICFWAFSPFFLHPRSMGQAHRGGKDDIPSPSQEVAKYLVPCSVPQKSPNCRTFQELSCATAHPNPKSLVQPHTQASTLNRSSAAAIGDHRRKTDIPYPKLPADLKPFFTADFPFDGYRKFMFLHPFVLHLNWASSQLSFQGLTFTCVFCSPDFFLSHSYIPPS